MNWTGGRLQRHSLGGGRANTRAVKAVQKQHFARARALRNARPSVSPVEFGWKNDGHEAVEADRVVQGGGTVRKRRPSTESTAVCLRDGYVGDERRGSGPTFNHAGQEVQSRDENVTRNQVQDIDSVRHGLLQQSDWANLSLARPLKTKRRLHSAEKNNFAKRRRLTSDDRHRLAGIRPGSGRHLGKDKFARYEGVLAVSRIQMTRIGSEYASVLNSDAMSIHIGEPNRGGVRTISDTPASTCRTMQMLSQESKESMLFDREERRPSCQAALSFCGGNSPQERYSTHSLQGQRDSEPLMSSVASPNIDVNEWERASCITEGQQRPTVESSPTSEPQLPHLDPCGSFMMRDGQTWYKPPSMASNATMPEDCMYRTTSTQPSTMLATSSPSKPAHLTQRRAPSWTLPEETNTTNGYSSDDWGTAEEQGGVLGSEMRPPVEIGEQSRPVRKEATNRPGHSPEASGIAAPSDGVEDGESIWRRFIFG